ncbi:hypothetical protein TNCV_2937651 [Trichonephila clavipes]|nr:hypothetical protein TNCV_2937651 [Trichonephila clavipes]
MIHLNSRCSVPAAYGLLTELCLCVDGITLQILSFTYHGTSALDYRGMEESHLIRRNSRTSFIRTSNIRSVKYPNQFSFGNLEGEKDYNDDDRDEITDFVQSIPGFQEYDEEIWKPR